MKLRQREIELIAQHIMNSLVEHECIETDDSNDTLAGMVRVIHDELKVEDMLNEEVRTLLESHSADMSKNKVEYHQAFNIVKRKLIKERNIIL